MYLADVNIRGIVPEILYLEVLSFEVIVKGVLPFVVLNVRELFLGYVCATLVYIWESTYR